MCASDILWMCKETAVLRGVLLIKGFPPTSLSSSSGHVFFLPSFLFPPRSCQVLLRFDEGDSLTNTFSFDMCTVLQQGLARGIIYDKDSSEVTSK